MSPLQRQRVAQISAEPRIHVVTLYNWSKTWRCRGRWFLLLRMIHRVGVQRQVHGSALDLGVNLYLAQRLLP
jgi:hypothetical protein